LLNNFIIAFSRKRPHVITRQHEVTHVNNTPFTRRYLGL